MDSTAWYVLKTKPKQEQRAKQNLENQGARTYLPLFSRTRIRNNKRVTIEEPLFPGYIFAQFTNEQPIIHKVRSTFGVINIVKFGQNLARIADTDMQLMYNDIQNLTSQMTDNGTHSAPRIGDCVEITQGPFSGLNATIVELSGSDRCLVMLEMLHKQVRADLSYNQVQKLEN